MHILRVKLVNHKKTVLLTGATGFVGSYLLKILLEEGCKVYALGRNINNMSAKDRIIDLLEFWDDSLLKKTNLLKVVKGDITKDSLGLNNQDISCLLKETEEIYHCAAVTNYSRTLHELEQVNVLGTKNVLEFARQCAQGVKFKKVNYISTAYVCGDYRGHFKESDLDVGQKFSSAYSQSKFEAETLINKYKDQGLWVDVFRPPIVVGESKTGKIPGLQQHFYQIIRVWSLCLFDFFPGRDYIANIVPVDDLCKSIVLISSNQKIKNKTYHLFSPYRVYLHEVLNIFKKITGIDKPVAVSHKDVSMQYITPSQRIILNKLFYTFNGNVNLDSNMTEGLLREYGYEFTAIDEKFFCKVFEYLAEINFIKTNHLSNCKNIIL